jgi:hypothetical protein
VLDGPPSTDRQWAVRPDDSPKVANDAPFQFAGIGQEIGQIGRGKWESLSQYHDVMKGLNRPVRRPKSTCTTMSSRLQRSRGPISAELSGGINEAGSSLSTCTKKIMCNQVVEQNRLVNIQRNRLVSVQHNRLVIVDHN